MRPGGRGGLHETELAEDRRGVEVDPLAQEPLVLEEEERHRPAGERPAGGRDPAQGAVVRSLRVELDDHRGVGVMRGDQLVALVGNAVRESSKYLRTASAPSKTSPVGTIS